jgi:hypothetical protein
MSIADSRAIQEVLTQLHEAKVLNIDATIRTLIQPAALRIVDPVEAERWYLLGGSGYAVVVSYAVSAAGESASAARALPAGISGRTTPFS